jgi:lactate dehydrogenase-like 2-hydroxyacid dehydrogenase
MTPHVAWASVEARTELMNGVIDNIREYQEKAE